MAYRFDLDRDFEAVPFVDQFGTAVIDFALGYELESSSVVLMSVMLVRGDSYLHGQISGIYDLQFGIRVRDLVSDKVHRQTSAPHRRRSTSLRKPKQQCWKCCSTRSASW